MIGTMGCLFQARQERLDPSPAQTTKPTNVIREHKSADKSPRGHNSGGAFLYQGTPQFEDNGEHYGEPGFSLPGPGIKMNFYFGRTPPSNSPPPGGGGIGACVYTTLPPT